MAGYAGNTTGAGKSCEAILTAIAHWLHHVGGAREVGDPMAADLRASWASAGRGGIVRAMFGEEGRIRSDWDPKGADAALIGAKLDEIAP